MPDNHEHAAEYLRNHYPDDLATWLEVPTPDEAMAVNGPTSLLCGMTGIKLTGAKNIGNYHSPEDFLSTIYAFNLVNQALFTYFPHLHYRWTQRSLPFVDCRCPSYHGGISRPDSILRYAASPSGYPSLVSISPSDETLRAFAHHCVFLHLPEVLGTPDALVPHGTFDPDEFLRRLSGDGDCVRFVNLFSEQ